MSNLVIPFDFNPSSVAVKTASYTIPAGKYARVVVNLTGTATFTIGGVTALSGSSNAVLSSSVMRQSATTPTALYTTVTSTTTGSLSFSGDTHENDLVAEYWLPTGTIINGSGTWRATVMEYNVIS